MALHKKDRSIRGGRVFASSSPLGCVCMGDWRQGCLIVPAGWGAIVGRKHLPTAFGSFEGKRPKRGREWGTTNDEVQSVIRVERGPPPYTPPSFCSPLFSSSGSQTPKSPLKLQGVAYNELTCPADLYPIDPMKYLEMYIRYG